MPTSKDLTDLDSQLKKTLISAESFKRGSYMDPSKSIANVHKTLGTLASHTRKLVIRVGSLEKIVNNNSIKITSLKNISKTQSERISGTNVGAKLPGGTTTNVEDNISAITKSVSSIAEILSGRKKLLDDASAYDKRKAEQEKRQLAESKLEKRFDGLKKVAEKVIAPVKNILDRIIDFFVTVFLGRVVYKLLEWFGDPQNAQKVNSIIRFLGDHWPKLLSLYLVFGTSFGRFAKGLLKAVLRGTFKLTALIFKLAAAKKIRGARKVAGFLGGGKGKLLANVIGTGVALGGTYAATQALAGDNKENKTQAYRGGGYVKPKFPTFSGGGLNFKGMMSGASMGAMFGPLGMLLGGMFGSGKPQQMMSGFVSGEKGVDKVPAFVSDGEFVMSRGAVEKYGVDTLERMNAAGGGTNQPTYFGGVAHAQGGGLIGNVASAAKFATNVLGHLNPFKSRGLSVGTRATAGFTGMGREGFENILKGQKYIASSKPQILGKGAYSAPTAKGASRYAQSMSSLGGKQTPGGIIKTIVPSNALRLSFIEPQSKVAAEVFDKGKILADKLLQGAYANSALANSLREQMQRGYVSRALTPMASMGRLLGRGIGALNAPVIGDMMFPESTAAYDQLTGPQAYYNAPGYGGPKPATISTIQSTPPRIVNPPMKRQPKIVTVQPQASNVKPPSNPSYQTVPAISAVHADGYSRNAQILGVR